MRLTNSVAVPSQMSFNYQGFNGSDFMMFQK